MYENDDVLNNIEKGVIGFAVGDAFGVPVEFTSRSDRKNNLIKEMVGNGSHNVSEGTWSDDTSMTLATFDSIRECGNINYEDIMDKYCDWIVNSKYTIEGRVFGVGSTTSKALYNYHKTKMNPIDCGGREENDNGNGSLMRMLPIVYYLHYIDLDYETKIDIIKSYSSLTHGHEVSILGCTIYYDYMSYLLKGLDKVDAYLELDIEKYREYFSEDSIERYRRILIHELKELGEDEIKSTGYVVDTLEAAIWVTLNTNTYEEAIIEAVSLGDDTDTIGAITGSMVGTIYGIESIPDRWLSKLKNKEYIKNLVIGYSDVLNDNNRRGDF